MSAEVSDQRFNRALAAYLRQEVQAPAAAISDFLDIIIEDARGLKLDHVLADLDRMRSASIQLTTFVKSVTADAVNDEKRGAIFPAVLTLKRDSIDVDGKRIRLSPGMNMTAEIKTGKRRVIDYMLSPDVQQTTIPGLFYAPVQG